MGRIFETRKHTMFARWNKMAKLFTRLAKEVAIAVKSGGPEPASNPALRRVLQNARAANMPKDKIDSAIKRANGDDQKAYDYAIQARKTFPSDPDLSKTLGIVNYRKGKYPEAATSLRESVRLKPDVSRQSPIANRQSPVGNQQSEISNQLWRPA